MLRRIPPRPFLDGILLRTAIVWVVLRGVTGLGSVGDGASLPEAVIGGLLTAILLFAVILIVQRVEMTRRSELVFLANLGISFLDVGVVIAVQCTLFEAALRIALA